MNFGKLIEIQMKGAKMKLNVIKQIKNREFDSDAYIFITN